MNSLDRFMELLLAGVFLLVGLSKIFTNNKKAKYSGPPESSGLMGLPYRMAALIGLFETTAALVLIMPAGTWPSATLALPAATALAVLMLAASIYRMRLRESAVPTIVLFLMAIFVVAARII
jgi:hypothetical protein